MTQPSSIGTVYVPGEGPSDAKMMFVGEAPGAVEEEEGRPFVGKSGQLLDHVLQRHDIQRSEVYITNLCKYRPPRNEFRKILNTDELAAGLEELSEDITRIKPNVIVACGAWPLHYLTGVVGPKGKPGTGILNWRGSVLPCTLVPGYKVLATIHPAYVLRAWTANPILHFDIGRAARECSDRRITHPEYEEVIDPDDDELQKIVSEMRKADFVSCDIETFGPGELACVGFADSESRGLCITCQSVGGFDVAKTLYESATPKIFQYGTYDTSFLRHFYGWSVGGYYDGQGFDTYVAAATLMPEFPRGLDFLTSIYTDFSFYKEERKIWKVEGDLMVLWRYNLKDVVATYITAMEQMREIREMFDE